MEKISLATRYLLGLPPTSINRKCNKGERLGGNAAGR